MSKPWLSLAFCIFLGIAVAPASALEAPPGLSADQLRLFNTLSPEQQAELLKRYQGQGSAQPRQEAVQDYEVIRPRTVDERRRVRRGISNADAQTGRGMRTETGRDAYDSVREAQQLGENAVRHPRGVADYRVDPEDGKGGGEGAEPIADFRERATETTDDATAEREPRPLPEAETDESAEERESEAPKQFGYDLFAGSPTTFAPVTQVPVPSEYIIGPGDAVVVQLYGKENATHTLTVTREGKLQFPGVGPLSVAGLSFARLQDYLNGVIGNQMIGVKASITMGNLRSITVFVLGEAHRPGSYTVSALSTMTNALFVSGGVQPIGSLRKIQLKRQGQVVTELDLYDLLMAGDTSQDVRLQPGDVIFVPPVGTLVSVAGEVVRPATYELLEEDTAEAVLNLAGGLLPTAYGQASRIERVNPNGNRELVNVDLSSEQGLKVGMRNGDVLQVYSVLDKMENIVKLSGHVQRPGAFAWRPGLRFSDVVSSPADLRPNPDLDYALVIRQEAPYRRIRTFYVNLHQALKRGVDDIALMPQDEIKIFDLAEPRSKQVQEVVETLRQQGAYDKPSRIAQIKGAVRFPGVYPLYEGMTLSGLVQSAFGMTSDAQADYVLVKHNDIGGKIRVASFDLSQGIPGNIALQPRDEVYVFSHRESPETRKELLTGINAQMLNQANNLNEAKVVTITGHVRFPGDYPLEAPMSAADLIRAAGGYIRSAYTYNGEVTRQRIDEEGAKTTQVIPIENLAEAAKDIELSALDTVHIKQTPNWTEALTVELAGEVVFPGTYSIRKGDTLSSLLLRAGGLSESADTNGAVFLRESLKEKEQEQLDRLAKELQSAVASFSLDQAGQRTDQKDTQSQDLAAMQLLLNNLQGVEALGRLVINLPAIVAGDPDSDVVLRDKDKIVFLPRSQEVSIVGEVHFPTSHLLKSDLDLDEYIARSGGLTSKADDDSIYIVRANGEVLAPSGKGWLGNGSHPIRPGDTIVVPYDFEQAKNLSYWTSITQILYQLSTSAAALKAIGAF